MIVITIATTDTFKESTHKCYFEEIISEGQKISHKERCAMLIHLRLVLMTSCRASQEGQTSERSGKTPHRILYPITFRKHIRNIYIWICFIFEDAVSIRDYKYTYNVTHKIINYTKII